MKNRALAITALGILLATSSAEAQQRWSFELRANGAVPTQDIGPDELGTGVGFEGTVQYRFLDHLAAYAGWDWIHFTADRSFAGPEMDFEETGYVFGLRFQHPLLGETGGGPAYWLRAGGTWDHVEIENAEGDLVGDSGHGLGWEAGAGLSLAVGTEWRLTPGVRFRSLSRDVEIESVSTDLDLNYVAFEIGVARRF